MSEGDWKYPIIFTPDNEPYLGRETVFHFDQVIVSALNANRQIAAFTHEFAETLTPLQRAACQIVPQGINIALSIRELIRQGYIFAALVLIRPLLERAAIISYLHAKPESVVLWEQGWKYGKRPTLEKMMRIMSNEADPTMTKAVCDVHNHIVHGDPISSYYNLIHLGDDRLGYAVGKALNHPELCDQVAIEAQCYLIVLIGRAADIFPRT
jgi:hypothetical protein